MEDTMEHATRIKALARQAGGIARNLAHGAVLSAGLMGMGWLGDRVEGPAGVRYSDTMVQPAPTVSELAMASTLAFATPAARAVPGWYDKQDRQELAAVSAPRLAERALKQPEAALLTPVFHQPALRDIAALVDNPFEQDEDALSDEMARVRDWIADTYRVSEDSIEPALAAAEIHAEELGFDPLLIVAIMAVESSFNHRAVSNMGALGLMQVIPRYHKDKIGPNRGRNVLFDPEVNVRVGTLVLHEGLQRYGSMQRALQYYNGSLKDPKARYPRKVMALKKRLMLIAGRDSGRSGGQSS
jgi:soluble lytic murein transglycosylase-like protein